MEEIDRKLTREDLPREAFAIVGDPDDPSTWKLPHHTGASALSLRGRSPKQSALRDRARIASPAARNDGVDWDLMAAAVAALSLAGHDGVRVEASPEQILAAAAHLAAHYALAGRPLPDSLAVLA